MLMILFSVLLMNLFAKNFLKFMQGEFEMSMMGEIAFFLGLQVKQQKKVPLSIQQNMSKTCSKGLEG